MLDYIHGSKKRLAAAVGAALLAGAFSIVPKAEANPVLDAKDAAVSISGLNTANMTITSGAENNLIKWVDFSIGKNESVTFDANNYLNYVTGSARSDILGTLTGGGSIYIVNPNGILIGDNATVNVGSLYLSTRNLTDEQLASYSAATGALFPATPDNGAVGDVINMGALNATSISVEGNNITFKNVADVKDATDTTGATLLGGSKVNLTASGGEIHIGSATGAESGYTTSGATYNYKLVNNATDLQNMKDKLDGNYMLAGDIPDVGAFSPVGKDFDNPFTGRFDGLNYKVSNLNLTAEDGGAGVAGLFGVNNGVVENLEVAGTTTVTNNTNYQLYGLGAVAGRNQGQGILRNVRNTSTIDASSLVVETLGGVAGVNKGTIDRAYNTGALTANSGMRALKLGGIAGLNGESGPGTRITNAFNQGALSDKGTNSDNDSFIGGVVGYMQIGSIENAYNSGSLTTQESKKTNSYLGGVVGYWNGGTVQQTYNSGELNGHHDVGGVVGNKVSWDNDPEYPSPNPLADSYSTYHQDRQVEYSHYYDVRDGNELTDDNKMKQGTYASFQFTDTESQKAVWRIYEDKTMPLLTAFLARADHSNGTTEYNGTATTGDVGTNYVESAFSGAVNQIGGVNYVYDYTKVTPKDLTVTFGKAAAKTYDGTKDIDKANYGAATLVGMIANDAVSLDDTNLTAAYEDKNAGENKKVSYSGIALKGDKAKNYNLTSTTYDDGTGDITAKEISVSFADVSKPYDGTKNATAGQGTLTDVLDADKDKVSVTGTATYDTKNAGTNKTINYTNVTLSGDEAGNYTIADTATGKGSIAKANITISTDVVTKTYDGTTRAPSTAAKVISGQIFSGDVISGGTFAFTDNLDSRPKY